jgi:hypothetical protein
VLCSQLTQTHSARVHSLLELCEYSVHWLPGAVFPEIKSPGCEHEHSSQSITKILFCF